MDAAVIIVHSVRLVPRVYAQDTIIFEQAGLKVSLERIPSPLWGAWAPLICVCRARLGQLSISLQVDKQLGSKKNEEEEKGVSSVRSKC